MQAILTNISLLGLNFCFAILFEVPLANSHNFVQPDDHILSDDDNGGAKLMGSVLDLLYVITGSTSYI